MFKELYYWMSNRLSNIPSNDNPDFNAYILIALLQIFNIGTLFIILDHFFLKIHYPKNAHIYIGLSEALIFFVINYFTLYTKRKVIFQKYEKMDAKRKKRGLIYFWTYVILSIVIFFVAAANLVTPKY
jgi:hypothetical protein